MATSSSSSSSSPLDGVAAIRHYLDRMIGKQQDSSGSAKLKGRMKALLLDASTTQIVSAVYSQTEILNHQVYLVSRMDQPKNNKINATTAKDVGHLVAVVFCRPTPTNIDHLGRLLLKPKFAEYHLFFSGILTSGLLRVLAEQDVHEKVAHVQEVFADFVPLNGDLWTLQSRHSLVMTTAAGTSWAPKYATQYERHTSGLQAMLLALKRQPSCIRYAASSACAEELAKDLHEAIVGDDLFHFRRSPHKGGLHVLIVDRRDDPVTPLLSQWTYQAMVHELLGLNNHRVVLRGAPNVPADLEEIVLNAQQDAFFAENCHANFGQLGERIQQLLRDYQQTTARQQQTSRNLNSIDEMQAFLEQFPELKSQSHTVSKHVAIMGELARLVEVAQLLEVSQLEQDLACNDDHNAHWRQLLQQLQSSSIKVPDKLRLGLLYALRYEQLGNLHMVQQSMSKGGVPSDLVQLVPCLLRYAGHKARGPGLYGDPNANALTKMTKNFMTSVQGIENVYAQHSPLVMDTIQQVAKGKLPTKTYPIVPGSLLASTVSSSASSGARHGTHSSNATHGLTGPTLDVVPDELLIFMVGGVTYEEGTQVHEFNGGSGGLNSSNSNTTGHNHGSHPNNPTGMQVVLAGSTVHNSTSFLDELRETAM